MKFSLFVISVFLVLSYSCTGQGKSKTAELPAPVEDQISEMGLLKQVEDSEYPFVNLVIEFPERKFTENFLLNLEEVDNVNPEIIKKWVGKYVKFNYTSDIFNALLDIRLDGESLLGMSDGDLPEGTQKITGVLSGAAEATAGDLPDVIYIIDPHEGSVEFEFFITQEMTGAEGKIVEGFFDERTVNKIAAIVLPSK